MERGTTPRLCDIAWAVEKAGLRCNGLDYGHRNVCGGDTVAAAEVDCADGFDPLDDSSSLAGGPGGATGTGASASMRDRFVIGGGAGIAGGISTDDSRLRTAARMAREGSGSDATADGCVAMDSGASGSATIGRTTGTRGSSARGTGCEAVGGAASWRWTTGFALSSSDRATAISATRGRPGSGAPGCAVLSDGGS